MATTEYVTAKLRPTFRAKVVKIQAALVDREGHVGVADVIDRALDHLLKNPPTAKGKG